MAPRGPVVKRAANPAVGAKPPAKRRHGAPQATPARPAVPLVPGSPISLALAAADAASNKGAVFQKTRTSAVDRDEEMANPDLGLDPADTVGLAWRDRNRAEADLQAESQAWVSTAAAWARAGMARDAGGDGANGDGLHAAAGRGARPGRPRGHGGPRPGGRGGGDDDTPPWTDMVERVEVEGGGGDAVLEEAPRIAPEGAPRAPTGGTPQVAAPQATPAAVPERTPERARERAPERAPVVEEAINSKYALVSRLEGRRAIGSQPARARPSELFFGPLTQEEAVMAAFSQRLRGCKDRIQAFAQVEVERTGELEPAVFQLESYRVGVFNRLLEKHQQLKEQLTAKEKALRVATAAAEVSEAKAEAAGARRALDEASRLQERLASDKSRLESEVDRLKAEAAKVVETQRALEEAGRLQE
nr:uncharacterized protein LOC120964591 [Aegilops tauschii subsp. strangulata]